MSDWLQATNDKITALEAGTVNPVEPDPPIEAPTDWHDYVDERISALSELMTPGEVDPVDIETISPPGDWTSYIHGRLSALEEQVHGSDQATAIAALAPPYDEAAFLAEPTTPAATDKAPATKGSKATTNTGSPPKG